MGWVNARRCGTKAVLPRSLLQGLPYSRLPCDETARRVEVQYRATVRGRSVLRPF